jgi:predicted O-methyltransferase YrrM
MPQPLWTNVDQYLSDIYLGPDPALDAALARSEAAGLPHINVTAHQGRLLHQMARMIGAKRILEIGTLGGYSTIPLARALPADGRLITLEFEPKHAAVARENLDAAGIGARVEIIVGPAIAALPKLTGPFDFVFIDADKVSTADYFLHAMRLTRPGSVIIVDNVVRDGEIINPQSHDDGVAGVRRFHDLVKGDTRVTATALQTVGGKGYDGFAVLLVNDDAR